MRVVVRTVLEVNPQEWREEYGTDETASEIVDIVNQRVHEVATAAFAHISDAVTVV